MCKGLPASYVLIQYMWISDSADHQNGQAQSHEGQGIHSDVFADNIGLGISG